MKRHASHGRSDFPSTRWSRLCGSTGTADLEGLCRDYWHPVRAFLRCRFRMDAESSEDRTQDFFVRVLEGNLWCRADRRRGSFRAFLMKALHNYMLDRSRAELALKRGGGRAPLSLDDIAGEAGPADPGSADAALVLEREWRRQLVARAMAEVRAELEREGKAVCFRVFEDYFLGAEGEVDYRTLAARYGITRHDVSNHLRKAKQRYRTRLRQLVMETVSDQETLDAELAWLFGPERRRR